jgi:hypothetical protein
MASLEDEVDRATAAARRLTDSLLGPWGGAAGCIDAYESGVRTVSDVLRSFARAVDVEPARTIAVAAADLTRDVGAAQISGARWLLDA